MAILPNNTILAGDRLLISKSIMGDAVMYDMRASQNGRMGDN